MKNFNPNMLLNTPIVKGEIKRWIKIGYEFDYILEKLEFIHKIKINENELNMFIENNLDL